MKWLLGRLPVCCRLTGIIAAGTLLLPLSDAQGAVLDDISMFRLLDYSGYLQSTNRYDRAAITSTGASGEYITSGLTFQRSAGISTRSYVYHPNMLLMDITGGIIWDQRQIDRSQAGIDAGGSNDNILDWNLSANLQFLQNKPYPFNLSFAHSDTLIPSNLAESFNQTNTTYGLGFSLEPPFSPVLLNVNASHSITSGTSLDQIVDEDSYLMTVNAAYNIPLNNDFLANTGNQFRYRLESYNSGSGNPNATIRPNEYTEHQFYIYSTWLFGKARQFELYDNMYLVYRNVPERVDARVTPYAKWRHTDTLTSYYRYYLSVSARPGTENSSSSAHRMSASLAYIPSDTLFGTAEVRSSYTGEGQSSRTGFGAGGSGTYIRTIPYGLMNVSAGLNFDYYNQSTQVNRVEIQDESQVLSGTTPVELARDFVIPSSIVITNATDTQTFIEGLDYEVIQVGARVQIRRLISGNILDGQTVLVNYGVEPGGSADYGLFNGNFNLVFNLARYYQVSLRYQENKQTGGNQPGFGDRNSRRIAEVDARADVPLRWRGIKVGADARYRIDEGSVNSSNSTNLQAYVQVPLPWRSSAQLTVRRDIYDVRDSDQDRDILGIYADLNARPWSSLTLNLRGRYESDKGGLYDTNRTEIGLTASYQIRRLKVNGNLRYLQERQGQYDRDTFQFVLSLRRDLW